MEIRISLPDESLLIVRDNGDIFIEKENRRYEVIPWDLPWEPISIVESSEPSHLDKLLDTIQPVDNLYCPSCKKESLNYIMSSNVWSCPCGYVEKGAESCRAKKT